MSVRVCLVILTRQHVSDSMRYVKESVTVYYLLSMEPWAVAKQTFS